MGKKYNEYKEVLADTYSIKHKVSTTLENPFFHLHDELELCLLLSDHMTCFVDNSVFLLEKNTLLLFNNTNLHFVHQNHPGSIYERYTLYFKPEMVDFATENAELLKCFFYRSCNDSCVLPLSEKNTAELIGLFEKLISIREQPQRYGADLYSKIIVSEILLNVNQWYQDNYSIDFMENEKEFTQIYPILRYLRENFQEDVNLDFLSKKFLINKSALCQYFKKTTAMTPNQYLVHCRLNQAKMLLTKEELPVETICEMVGYHSMPHFSRSFKRLFGISPKKYQLRYSKHISKLESSFESVK